MAGRACCDNYEVCDVESKACLFQMQLPSGSRRLRRFDQVVTEFQRRSVATGGCAEGENVVGKTTSDDQINPELKLTGRILNRHKRT